MDIKAQLSRWWATELGSEAAPNLVGLNRAIERLSAHQRIERAAELFPANVRALGVGFPYAIAVSLFGGTAEYIALDFKKYHHQEWFYWYVTICIALSLVLYITMNDTRKYSKIE